MKRYLVFIGCFVLLMTAIQLISGWVMTVLYTPDISALDSSASQTVPFGEYSPVPFLVTLITVTLAYFISEKVASN